MTEKFTAKESELHDLKQEVKSSFAYKDNEIKMLSEKLRILAKAVASLTDRTFGRCSLFVPVRHLAISFFGS